MSVTKFAYSFRVRSGSRAGLNHTGEGVYQNALVSNANLWDKIRTITAPQCTVYYFIRLKMHEKEYYCLFTACESFIILTRRDRDVVLTSPHTAHRGLGY